MPSKQNHRPAVEEDLVFQQRDWRFQRVGWAVLALLVVAGLAGLLGPGPLSNADARGGRSLQVEYERFVRHGDQSDLRVSVAQPQSGEVRVAISREYLEAVKLQQVLPSPTRVQASGQMLVYVFEHSAGGASMQATFVVQPDRVGTHLARIALDDGSSVSIRQFTYP